MGAPTLGLEVLKVTSNPMGPEAAGQAGKIVHLVQVEPTVPQQDSATGIHSSHFKQKD